MITPQGLKDNKDVEFLDYGEILIARYTEDVNKNHNITTTQNSIIFIDKGQKILRSSGDSYIVNENEIVFLRQGSFVMSDITSLQAGVYQSYFLSFSNMVLLEFIKKHKYLLDRVESKPVHMDIFKIKTDIFLVEQIKSLDTFLNNKKSIKVDSYKEIINLKIEILLLLLMNKEDGIFSEFVRSIANSIPFDFRTMLIQEDIDFYSVKEMADMFNMDISLFSKRFKNSFGISPKEWLDNKHFERAKLLVEFSNKNITEICQEFNFNSVSWFIKRFKLRYGKTPKQLQKSNNLYFYS